jgi:tRNA A-37 threonylcarbamoyl transferase component Bud32
MGRRDQSARPRATVLGHLHRVRAGSEPARPKVEAAARSRLAEPESRPRRRRGRATPILIADRYHIEQALGRGGSAAVYRARDAFTGRTIALKRLIPDDDDDTMRRRALRLRREFHTLAGLRHPNIVEVYDYGVDGGVPFYTMELLDGADLSDARRLPFDEACRLLRDVASALAFLHARQLVHRDLSPNNVRCTASGQAKLFDFGLLATSGVLGAPGGTPPCMAPEALRDQPVDHRADLYALGALAYYLVTGRYAFPARELDELEAIWRRGVVPPSRRLPSLPRAFDELVVSLLSLDPLGRPSSAVEVIDRLGGIGKLPPLPAEETARGYLASATLVGRKSEVRRLRQAARLLRRRRGSALALVGERGAGKTRLLREAALSAQLAGARVIHADGEVRSQGPYRVLGALARQLLIAVPRQARAALTPARLRLLATAIPEIAAATRHTPVPHEQALERLAVQRELTAWVLDIARRRPLALLIDDLQSCDEASAAVLASLAGVVGEGEPLLLVAAWRGEAKEGWSADERVAAPAALSALAARAQRLRLGGLDRKAVGELVRTLFGALKGADELTAWIHDATCGNPLSCQQLARHLVESGQLRFVEGRWQLAGDLARAGSSDSGLRELPRVLADAIEARVGALSPDARALAEVLALLDDEADLELCAALFAAAARRGERQMFCALDELLQKGVLQGAERVCFAQRALCEAVCAQLAPQRKRELHLAVGQVLRERGGDDRSVGWHLLEGGERGEGAAFLERAGRAAFAVDAFSDAIPPLEAALAAYERDGSPRRLCLELRELLIRSGVRSDRRVVLRYGDDTVNELTRAGGLELARRLRFLGRWPALILAVLWRLVVYVCTPSRRRGPRPKQALLCGYRLLGLVGSTRGASFDLEGLRATLRKMEPLALLSRRRRAYMPYLYIECLLLAIVGRHREVAAKAELFFEIEARDRLTPVDVLDRKLLFGAMRFVLATIAMSRQDARCLDDYEVLDRAGDIFPVGARIGRCLYYRLRGEERRAAELEREAQLLHAQLGAVSVLEAQRAWVTAMAYASQRDVSGLRRSIDELRWQVQRGYRLESFLELTTAEYQRERGELEASLERLERLSARGFGGSWLLEACTLCALSLTLEQLGEPDQARQVAARAVALTDHPDTGGTPLYVRAVRCLARAEAALGRYDQAAERLDELMERGLPLGDFAEGSICEARAEVAWLAGDVSGYRSFLSRTERHFRRTRNPVLIARYENLAALSTRRRLVSLPGGKALGATDHALRRRRQRPAEASATRPWDKAREARRRAPRASRVA